MWSTKTAVLFLNDLALITAKRSMSSGCELEAVITLFDIKGIGIQLQMLWLDELYDPKPTFHVLGCKPGPNDWPCPLGC